ncbi:MAG: hypothetical protein ACM3SV_11660 [Betaproteobacteria bacterium]
MTVDADAAGDDPFFHFAARTDAGFRQYFVQTLGLCRRAVVPARLRLLPLAPAATALLWRTRTRTAAPLPRFLARSLLSLRRDAVAVDIARFKTFRQFAVDGLRRPFAFAIVATRTAPTAAAPAPRPLTRLTRLALRWLSAGGNALRSPLSFLPLTGFLRRCSFW